MPLHKRSLGDQISLKKQFDSRQLRQWKQILKLFFSHLSRRIGTEPEIEQRRSRTRRFPRTQTIKTIKALKRIKRTFDKFAEKDENVNGSAPYNNYPHVCSIYSRLFLRHFAEDSEMAHKRLILNTRRLDLQIVLSL